MRELHRGSGKPRADKLKLMEVARAFSTYVETGAFLAQKGAELNYMLKYKPREVLQTLFDYSVRYGGR